MKCSNKTNSNKSSSTHAKQKLHSKNQMVFEGIKGKINLRNFINGGFTGDTNTQKAPTEPHTSPTHQHSTPPTNAHCFFATATGNHHGTVAVKAIPRGDK